MSEQDKKKNTVTQSDKVNASHFVSSKTTEKDPMPQAEKPQPKELRYLVYTSGERAFGKKEWGVKFISDIPPFWPKSSEKSDLDVQGERTHLDSVESSPPSFRNGNSYQINLERKKELKEKSL
jgi:hypothetical protein